MKSNPYYFKDWKYLIPDIDQVITEMNSHNILSVGITPYSRIIPSFFLNNYSICALRRSADIEAIENFIPIYVIEDINPGLVRNIKSTTQIITSQTFQNILDEKKSPKLMFYTINESTANFLNKRNIPWIGNNPETFDDVKYKNSFRALVKKLNLPALESHIFEREKFLSSPFELFYNLCDGAFVVQRGDKEAHGTEGTFFIRNINDFNRCVRILSHDEKFKEVLLSPFVEGHSTSMLGCITEKGVLSGPLQIQLIDIPESLHGIKPNGVFVGNDISFHPWSDSAEKDASLVVEGIGKNLQEKGYKGIFGIDFLYDVKREKIFPNECNPRFTGSLMLYSLSLLESKVPPLEFFHLLSHLDIKSDFNFEEVNKALKGRHSCSHVTFSPKDIFTMKLPLLAGVYSYDEEKKSLEYKRPGISLDDLKNKNEFLMIDIIPKVGQPVEQNAPKFFKFIFPYGIAKSSYEIEKRAAFLVDRFAKTLLESQ